MGKSCLNKLSGNIVQGCMIPLVGVKNIYLMHAEDVDLATDSDRSTVTSIKMGSDAAVILVEGYKQNIQLTSSVRAMDASTKLDINVTFKMPLNSVSAEMRARSLLTGKFYVAVERNDDTNSIVGYTSPLECSALDWDSNANAGLATVTLSAPEGSSGNYFMRASVATMKSIKSKIKTEA